MPEHATAGTTPIRPRIIAMPVLAAPPLGKWHGRGLCAGEDPGIFFPAHGDPGTKARQVCAGCPVRGDCLEYAANADEYGIWGGLDQGERRNLRRRQHRGQATARALAGQPGDAA